MNWRVRVNSSLRPPTLCTNPVIEAVSVHSTRIAVAFIDVGADSVSKLESCLTITVIGSKEVLALASITTRVDPLAFIDVLTQTLVKSEPVVTVTFIARLVIDTDTIDTGVAKEALVNVDASAIGKVKAKLALAIVGAWQVLADASQATDIGNGAFINVLQF